MKSLKKLITVVLALAMMLTSVGIPAFAANFSDITDLKVADAVDKLVAYGIITGYEDGTFKPDNQITRAEFAAIVTRMKGVADSLGSDAVTGFSDLDNDSSRAWARPYVKAAVDLKIINGFEDGTFRAAEPVTYEQAVKMLVCAVGYDVVASSEYNRIIVSNPDATWSAGYISAANKHGITKGVITAQISQPASRGVVAVLTSNGLEVPALVPDENGNLVKPEEGTEETEGNMSTITGIVTGTFYTGIDDDETGLRENEIYIDAADNDDDGEYTLSRALADSIDLDNYIGRRVDAYYDNLDGEITSINIKSNASTVINEGSIESVNGYSIGYKNENGRSVTADLNNYRFIVNGKYVEGYDFDNLKNGTIEYFSTGQYKIAKVNSYEVFVVNRFDKNNEKIFIKYDTYNGNNFYEFPTVNADKPAIYVKSSGSAYKLTSFDSLSLSQYDVINYLESPAGTAGDPVRKMYVTKGAESGKVTARLEGEREVEIENDTYYLTQQYYNYDPVEGSADKKAPFEISDNYTFYLDYTGQIAAINYNENSGSWSYGYLVDVDTRTNEVGIIEDSGEYKIYSLKDTIKVDGEKMKPSPAFDILRDAAGEIDDNANDNTLSERTGYAQPIMYSVSGEKIEAFDTILGDYENLVRGDEFTYDGALGDSPTSTSTTKVTAGGSTYSVNSKTFVLYVPKDRTDTDSYAKMSVSSAFSVSNYRYVEVFAVDDNLAKMVIVYGINPTLNFIGNTPYMIVTQKGGDGDENQLTGYVNGSASESPVTISDNNFVTDIGNNANLVSYSQVEEGDIIRYIKDSKGKAIAIEMVYDKSEGVMYKTEMDEETPVSVETQYIRVDKGSGSDFVAIFGTVTRKDATDNRVEIDADESRNQKIGSNTQIFKLSSGDVTISSIEEVYDGSDGMDNSVIILISTRESTETAATLIYVIE